MKEQKLWQLVTLLLCGLLLTCLTQMRWGVGWLAWVAPVPYLRYLRHTKGWVSRVCFVVVFVLGWVLAVAKIVTSPLPFVMAIGFGVLIGVILVPGYLLWGWLHRRIGGTSAALSFAAAMVVLEWLQHIFTPLATWGAAAYTQVGHLTLLQSLSLFGMSGLGFLLYWAGGMVELVVEERRVGVGSFALVGVVVATLLFGSVRLAVGDQQEGESTLVAAVGTDATFGGLPLPGAESVRQINKALFARTHRAARAGAKMVVWNEGATLIMPKDDAAWQTRLSQLAKAANTHLVAAYIMPVSLAPLRYENKYVWFRPDGQLAQIYHKHKPVMGEPAIAGKAPHRAIQTAFGRVAGAICYDYDYPRLGLAHSRLRVGLAVVPSSDWRGIDPIHTQMAAFRAIEGGHSVLRSTRLGLSAGIDGYGRFRSWQSAFARHQRIMWVSLPTKAIFSLYARIGDLFVVLCGLWLLWLFFWLQTIYPRHSNEA